MRMSLMQKFAGLSFLLICMGSAVVAMTYQTLGGEQGELANAKHLNDLAMSSQLAVSEMGSALKGYLLNPNDQKQADKKKAADDENSAILTEMLTLSKHEALLKVIGDLKELDDTKLNPSEDKVQNLVTTGKQAEAQSVFVKEYLPLRDQYDDLCKKLAFEARTISQAQIKAVADSTRHALVMIISTIIGCLTLVGGAILATGFQLRAILRNAVNQLAKAAVAVRDSATAIAENSKSVSDRALQQASALQETASAVEQVNATVGKNAANSQESSELATESIRKANDGKSVVGEMRVSMSDITDSNLMIMSQVEAGNKEIYEVVTLISEIGAKTKIINDIVFQTKLLSFNASVEAARAGENGKGFAVVAEEVGNLAQMSGRAAKEISDLLDGSVKKVGGIVENTKNKVNLLLNEGSKKVSAGKETVIACETVLEELAVNVERVNSMLSEVNSSSREQAAAVSEISKAIQQIDQVTQQTASATKEFLSTSVSLKDQSEELFMAVGHIHTAIEGSSGRHAQAA